MDAMLNQALEGFLGLLRQLMMNLLGPNGAEWAAELKKFLRKEPCWANRCTLQAWKTVQLGVYKNAKVLRKKLTGVSEVSGEAGAILGHPALTLEQSQESVTLCRASVSDLTGKKHASTRQVFDAIKDVGGLCPAEVGPALREEYLNQPHGEWVVVAMDPIDGGSGVQPYIFIVGCGGDVSKLWLHAERADPDRIWIGSVQFAFMFRSL